MTTTRLTGELEIDHKRGVVYFHTNQAQVRDQYGTITILRISNLPPIPTNKPLDIIHMEGSSWGGTRTRLKSD